MRSVFWVGETLAFRKRFFIKQTKCRSVFRLFIHNIPQLQNSGGKKLIEQRWEDFSHIKALDLTTFIIIFSLYDKMLSQAEMQLLFISSLTYGFQGCYYYYLQNQSFPYLLNENMFQPNLFVNEGTEGFRETKRQQNNFLPKTQQTLERPNNHSLERLQSSRIKKNADSNFHYKYQKQDRNLNSIVLRNFVNFVNSHPIVSNFVALIISKRELTMTASCYLEMFKSYLPSKQSYVGVGKMKTFIDSGNENNEIKIITLVLLRKFINTDYFTVLINSKKVTKSAREKELRHGKKFWNFFINEIL